MPVDFSRQASLLTANMTRTARPMSAAHNTTLLSNQNTVRFLTNELEAKLRTKSLYSDKSRSGTAASSQLK